MSEWKVPVQSLIDHIKTAVDVDPWAKEMTEELLKEQEPVEPVESGIPGVLWCGACKRSVMREEGYIFKHCPWCGKKVKWE